MNVLVDTLKEHPKLLDQVELRVSTMKAPAIDVTYTVEDKDD